MRMHFPKFFAISQLLTPGALKRRGRRQRSGFFQFCNADFVANGRREWRKLVWVTRRSDPLLKPPAMRQIENYERPLNSYGTETYRRIAEFEVDEPAAVFTFTDKLAKENEWSHNFAMRVVDEYKKFVFLAITASHPVSPSDQVDQAWHLHLTYTRSYWNEFCPKVLGRPLHHGPSQGGVAEQKKFVQWYEQTLKSYRYFFGHEPPSDIWPDPKRRFSEDVHYRRVNTQRHWIIPKSTWPAASAVLLTVVIAIVAGCVLVSNNHKADSRFSISEVALPDVFNLSGPQFMAVYAIAFAVAACSAAVMRWCLKMSAPASPPAIRLDPYEVAHLAGGSERAVNAALASLVSRDLLKIEENRFWRINDGVSVPLHPLEDTVLQAVDPHLGREIDQLHEDLQYSGKIANRLRSLGLIVSEERVQLGQAALFIVLSVPLLGAIKVLVGLSREKPVGFLVIACIVSAVVAIAVFGERLHRTYRGDCMLDDLKADKSFLLDIDRTKLAGLDLVLALALFNVHVLVGGPHEELRSMLARREMSGGGCGSGCGNCDGCGGCGGCG